MRSPGPGRPFPNSFGNLGTSLLNVLLTLFHPFFNVPSAATATSYRPGPGLARGGAPEPGIETWADEGADGRGGAGAMDWKGSGRELLRW